MSRLFMVVAAEAEGNSSFCLPTKYAGRNKQTNKQCGVRQETGRDGEGGGGSEWSRHIEESFWGTMSASSPETNAPADTLPYAEP